MFASPLNMPRRTWILVVGLLLLGAFFQYSSINHIRNPADFSTGTTSSGSPNGPKPPPPCTPGTGPASHSIAPVNQKAPTGNSITLRLHTNVLEPAISTTDTWNFAVMPTKPDVFIVSEGKVSAINEHYDREHFTYSLMKWILRVHRRDTGRIARKEPLIMIDAGSNHGLFSMVAGVSGAYVVAFEPQAPLRGVIGYSARLNQIEQHLRILPFAVLDKFSKVSISDYERGDGGNAFLDLNRTTGPIQTQTIRLDHLPSFARLFPEQGPNALGPHDQSFGEDYAAYLEQAHNLEPANQPTLSATDTKKILLRQPIHFLKIDVEGFELRALESASALYEVGLIEHTVLEFGSPDRWTVTEPQTAPPEQIKTKTLAEAKIVLNKAVTDWNLDIYLLPSIGWEQCKFWINWRLIAPNDVSEMAPPANGVRWLKAWNFDGLSEQDQFDEELKSTNGGVTEFIRLPNHLIDEFLDSLEQIGEVYLWMRVCVPVLFGSREKLHVYSTRFTC
ncbi:hypothetical protein BC936DRAFT_145009 [Jimgerdemannia flammicorona]|uniref:Methyltransferase FkbM domain-containing protein n=1 Tax=Jimgerdemannia flammicorona TaxID=994334 RepID=A0A433DB54_9FUNG|nr:hypothetical protein BC936DRAFT_145009 [Jimgerdemannia flammicorona]